MKKIGEGWKLSDRYSLYDRGIDSTYRFCIIHDNTNKLYLESDDFNHIVYCLDRLVVMDYSTHEQSGKHCLVSEQEQDELYNWKRNKSND